jgi:hypothetical protein
MIMNTVDMPLAIAVPDHGRDHNRGGAAKEALQQAQGQEPEVAGTEHQHGTGNGKRCQSEQRQRTPAMPVRQWTVYEHARAETKQEDAERILDGADTGGEIVGNLRYRRQVHVDSQRRQCSNCRHQQ